MIRLRWKYWGKLTEQDKRRLMSLTLSGDTGFKMMLSGRRDTCDDSIVVIARDTETNKWIGWGVGEPLQQGKTIEVGVYVRYRYRRRGIGKRLIRYTIKKSGLSSVRCFMWSNEAEGFYRNSFGAHYTHEYTSHGNNASRFVLETV